MTWVWVFLGCAGAGVLASWTAGAVCLVRFLRTKDKRQLRLALAFLLVVPGVLALAAALLAPRLAPATTCYAQLVGARLLSPSPRLVQLRRVLVEKYRDRIPPHVLGKLL